MAKCDICTRNSILEYRSATHTEGSNRVWKPNIRKVTLVVDGVKKRMERVCAKCLRSSKAEKTV